MSRKALENEITSHITEVTSSLEMAEYAALMRWLSWKTQARMTP